MGTECSNCKCANGEEEKILVIDDRPNTYEVRKKKLNERNSNDISTTKSRRVFTKDMLTEIFDYNPGLENKIIKVQGLMKKYKCKAIYKLILNKTRETQNYFKSEEMFETLGINKLKDLTTHNSTYTYKNGSVYSGDWLGGFRHGYGKMLWPDGTYYEGMWNLGSAEGEGLLSYSNGNFSRGEFRHNKLNGSGECFNADLEYKYIGLWINDLQNGQGTETWPDGSEYLGLFENGNKEKFGKYCWSDGSYYIGEWKDNKINGYVSIC